MGSYLQNLRRKIFTISLRTAVNPEGNVVLQDNDPSQNSKAARVEMERMNVVQFSIPPRSPDCNPIENIFNLAIRKTGRRHHCQ